MRDISVCADKKIGQRPPSFAAPLFVFLESFSSLKRGIQRQRHMGESRKAVFEFPLSVEFNGQFGEYYFIIADWSGVSPSLELMA